MSLGLCLAQPMVKPSPRRRICLFHNITFRVSRLSNVSSVAQSASSFQPLVSHTCLWFPLPFIVTPLKRLSVFATRFGEVCASLAELSEYQTGRWGTWERPQVGLVTSGFQRNPKKLWGALCVARYRAWTNSCTPVYIIV